MTNGFGVLFVGALLSFVDFPSEPQPDAVRTQRARAVRRVTCCSAGRPTLPAALPAAFIAPSPLLSALVDPLACRPGLPPPGLSPSPMHFLLQPNSLTLL